MSQNLYNPRRPSHMSHEFSRAPQADIQRSSFSRTNTTKTALNAGYLVPVFVDEVLPGDTFSVDPTFFARFATLEVPYMDNVYFDWFFFFVPNRLVWDNWERFNGAQDNPVDSTDFILPTMTSPAVTGYAVESLQDYFTLPIEIAGISHQCLPLRCYNLIWNEWFRDENLQDSVVVDKDDGPDDPADYVLLKRGKRYDYFTSCLPWPQKGPSVSIPLSGDAPIMGLAGINTNTYTNAGNAGGTWLAPDGSTVPASPANWSSTITASVGGQFRIQGDNTTKVPAVYADLSDVAAATINQLREAFQLQKLYERDARGGTRYIEILRSHFGVISPDARLQRPEYLGGGSTPISVNPIAQTSVTASTPQANLAAIGVLSHSGGGFSKSFVEHGHIIGLCSIRADLTYQQGLDRMWSRSTRFDFYWPAFAHLGEQAVLNKEIYAQGTSADDDVFGYQERWAEYRYKPSHITGKLRSTYATSLDVWHLAQEFDSLPVLGDEFIQENPPIDRVIAVQNEPQFILDCYFKMRTARPMPLYSVPGLIDHF